MPRVNGLLCLLLMFAVTACGPTVYTHPTKTSADFERDKRKCTKIAEDIACNNWKMCSNTLVIKDETNKCLLKMGWRPKK